MKRALVILALVQITLTAQAQTQKGTVVVERIPAPSLSAPNAEAQTRMQRVTVYLPPGYQDTSRRYPVIYYLHGFTWSDSLQIAEDHFDQLLDQAISRGVIQPLIVVMPNNHTEYRGSFYTNSSLTGDWSDFNAIDVVQHMDATYRTVSRKEGRGLAGHSMGGYGAIKLGMLFPDVFSSVYALSPAGLGLAKEFGARSDVFRRIQEIDTKEELFADFLANGVIAAARAFSPNPNRPPFYADLPFSFDDGTWRVDDVVLAKWKENLPLDMVDDHIDNLRALEALKLDWGRNEPFDHIPVTSLMFSHKLESLGIDHYAEEYIGDHSNKLWTDDGRAMNDMLPFFNQHLEFEE